MKQPNNITPGATYRLQFNKNFKLRDAINLVEYLDDLGISHIYSSPLLKAVPGSMHGYDVCDFTRINPKIGTEDDLAELSAKLKKHGMGLILDIVPNHMGIATRENKWWWDVLKYGQASRYADFFDIDWDGPKVGPKVILPVLENRLESEVKSNQIILESFNNQIVIAYHENRYPISDLSIKKFDIKNENIAEINLDKDKFAKILEDQSYVLSDGTHDGLARNYLSYFNVSSLARINIDNATVFDESHRKVLDWYGKGYIDGFRIDHFEGLDDYKTYLKKLSHVAPGSWIIIEKYFSFGNNMEKIPEIDGTVGCDFLLNCENILVSTEGKKQLDEVYSHFSGLKKTTLNELFKFKKVSIEKLFALELGILEKLFLSINSKNQYSPGNIRTTIIEIISHLPVRRTYINADYDISAADLRLLDEVTSQVKTKNPELAHEVNAIFQLLTREERGNLVNRFISIFQQLSVAAMAKGMDIAASLDGFGEDPDQKSISISEFHQENIFRQSTYPKTLNSLSTHDTKKSEDVNARMAVLAEIPQAWSKYIHLWSETNDKYKTGDLPNDNIEYLYYQLLVSSWPISFERILFQVKKAAWDADIVADWIKKDGADAALERFIHASYRDEEFFNSVEEFVKQIKLRGYINSLSQTLLKLTSPGIPDTYQGLEIWDFSLANPDNRRPVDFSLRKNLLQEATNISAIQTWQKKENGLPKMYLIHEVLSLRKQNPRWFDGAAKYQPVYATGVKKDHIIAFSRAGSAITVVPRLQKDTDGWEDTKLELPSGEWHNIFDDRRFSKSVDVGKLFEQFPVALLVKK